MDFDLDFNFESSSKKTKVKKEDVKQDINSVKTETIKTHKAGKRHICRKYTSETIISNSLPWHLKDGDCYHCISMGNVDSFSYAKALIKSKEFDYMLLSTWCMAGEDVLEIKDMLERGILKHVDFYVGEIFQKSYYLVFEMVLELCKQFGCRLCIFKNHSKVMVLKSPNEYAVVESSANINTNPRTENTVITIDNGLADFYIDFYNNIVNFNKDLDKYWVKFL